MPTEDLMKPRYKVIADWPGVAGKVGTGDILVLDDEMDVFWCGGNPYKESKLKDYPHLFKKLQWWEERTIEQFKQVEFAKVTHYVGYWRVGDIVPIEKVVLGENDLYGYNLKYKHFHPFCYVEPATEKEFMEQKNNNQ